jgi:hypothetical protein
MKVKPWTNAMLGDIVRADFDSEQAGVTLITTAALFT